MVIIHASFIEETREILQENLNEKDEENTSVFPENPGMFDTQIINKGNYNLEILNDSDKHNDLI